jgi:hypothetical protein
LTNATDFAPFRPSTARHIVSACPTNPPGVSISRTRNFARSRPAAWIAASIRSSTVDRPRGPERPWPAAVAPDSPRNGPLKDTGTAISTLCPLPWSGPVSAAANNMWFVASPGGPISQGRPLPKRQEALQNLGLVQRRESGPTECPPPRRAA